MANASKTEKKEVPFPNPNYRIDKANRWLKGINKYPYKVMWTKALTGSALYRERSLMGRVFKNEDAMLRFAFKLKTKPNTEAVYAYVCINNRWEPWEEKRAANT